MNQAKAATFFSVGMAMFFFADPSHAVTLTGTVYYDGTLPSNVTTYIQCYNANGDPAGATTVGGEGQYTISHPNLDTTQASCEAFSGIFPWMASLAETPHGIANTGPQLGGIAYLPFITLEDPPSEATLAGMVTDGFWTDPSGNFPTLIPVHEGVVVFFPLPRDIHERVLTAKFWLAVSCEGAGGTYGDGIFEDFPMGMAVIRNLQDGDTCNVSVRPRKPGESTEWLADESVGEVVVGEPEHEYCPYSYSVFCAMDVNGTIARGDGTTTWVQYHSLDPANDAYVFALDPWTMEPVAVNRVDFGSGYESTYHLALPAWQYYYLGAYFPRATGQSSSYIAPMELFHDSSISDVGTEPLTMFDNVERNYVPLAVPAANGGSLSVVDDIIPSTSLSQVWVKTIHYAAGLNANHISSGYDYEVNVQANRDTIFDGSVDVSAVGCPNDDIVDQVTAMDKTSEIHDRISASFTGAGHSTSSLHFCGSYGTTGGSPTFDVQPTGFVPYPAGIDNDGSDGFYWGASSTYPATCTAFVSWYDETNYHWDRGILPCATGYYSAPLTHGHHFAIEIMFQDNYGNLGFGRAALDP